MTLRDLLKLICHYAKLCLTVTVVCLLAGTAFGAVKQRADPAYSAQAVLTVSEPTATLAASELMPVVAAIATNITADLNSEILPGSQSRSLVTMERDAATRSVIFKADGDTVEGSIAAANDAARRTADAADACFSQIAQEYRDSSAEGRGESALGVDSGYLDAVEKNRVAAYETVTFTLNEASEVTDNGSTSGLLKYTLVGLVVGLFLAICLMVALNLVRSPVKSRQDLEAICDEPVLLEPENEQRGDWLWANIQFAVNCRLGSVCLLPVGVSTPVKLAEDVVAAVRKMGRGAKLGDSRKPASEDVIVVACNPLDEGMEAIYQAREADATVVCVQKWLDSQEKVADVLAELQLARVRVVGLALLDSGK